MMDRANENFFAIAGDFFEHVQWQMRGTGSICIFILAKEIAAERVVEKEMVGFFSKHRTLLALKPR
jgi:hypothetical protein